MVEGALGAVSWGAVVRKGGNRLGANECFEELYILVQLVVGAIKWGCN